MKIVWRLVKLYLACWFVFNVCALIYLAAR